MALKPDRSRFLGNVAAYAASEAAGKASRLLVVLAVSRFLEPAEIGLAAAALAAAEILKSLTENGVVQRIVAAPDGDLDAACRAAHRLFWMWCGGLFALQALGALAFYILGGAPLIAAMAAILAVEYLFMPGGLVQCALAMRAGRLKETAFVSGAQIVGANLLTAALACAWPSAWALVLPKIISAPVWLIGMRRLSAWRPNRGERLPARRFVRFGASVLGVEALKALRLQADKLIIGGLLGAEALGAWFFAVNAGLGLATSFATAFSTVLFPHLCAAENRERTFGVSLGLGLAVLAPIVLLQATLAPVYVPILFGERWSELASLVSILCLAAIPALIWAAAGQWLRAHDQAGLEFRLSVLLAALTVAAVAGLAPIGLEAVAWGVLVVSSAFLLGFCIFFLQTRNRALKEV